MRGMHPVIDFNLVMAEIYRSAGDFDPEWIGSNLRGDPDVVRAVRELRKLSASIGGASWAVSFSIPNGELLEPCDWLVVPEVYIESAGLFTIQGDDTDADYASYLGIRSGLRRVHLLISPVADYTRCVVNMAGAAGRSRRAVEVVRDRLARLQPLVHQMSSEREVAPME
jgi:hypothetical protein